jgi:hypothetical protein
MFLRSYVIDCTRIVGQQVVCDRGSSRILGEFHDYLRRIRGDNFGGFHTMLSHGWMNAAVWCLLTCGVLRYRAIYQHTFPSWVSVTLHWLRIGHVSVAAHPHAAIAASPDDCRATTQVPLTPQNVSASDVQGNGQSALTEDRGTRRLCSLSAVTNEPL